MAWVRIDDQAPEHPKLLRAGLEATGLWIRALAYCSRYLTDGHVPREAVAHMAGKASTRLTSILVDCGLWTSIPDGGFRVHDYNEYQPSRAQVTERRMRTKAKVEEWRKRKGYAGGNSDVTGLQGGYKSVSNPAPVPVPVPDPGPVPKEPTVCVPTPTVKTLTKPLGYRPRIDVAWPGRPPVPGSLHAEFRDKLGGDPETADARLNAWYPIAAEAWQSVPIGDDDWKFWRLRFREWVGTTRQAMRTHAAPPPAYTDADWCDHDPRCNSREWHALVVAKERPA